MSDETIDDLRLRVAGSAQEAHLDFIYAQSHASRVAALQKGVDYACNLLEKHKDKKQGLQEDQITLQICEMLEMAGFQAVHDEYVAGHCDIVVKGRDRFLWLAEAKKHSDYTWLNKGFKQLATRYSTGVEGQDHGEVLLYCYVKDAKATLDRWRTELQAKNPKVSTEDSPCGNPLLFCSKHKHDASGLEFHTRHKAIVLYWEPKDK